jgi:hypothetical protein
MYRIRGKLAQASILQKVNARRREMNRMLSISSGGVTFFGNSSD